MDLTFILIAMAMLVPFWFMLAQRAVNCPQCGKPLRKVMSPWKKSRRQWADGGYFCEQCEIEIDLKGTVVPADAPPIRSSAIARALAPPIVGVLLTIIASYFVLHWGMAGIKQWATAGHGSPASTQQQERTNATEDSAVEPGIASLPSGRSVEFVKSSGNVVRPSAADLSMYHSGPFRPDEISSSPYAAKSDEYLSSFAAHLSEQARRDAGRLFDDSMKAIDRGSPEKYEARSTASSKPQPIFQRSTGQR